jgi:hypothetical protein
MLYSGECYNMISRMVVEDLKGGTWGLIQGIRPDSDDNN